ncbi:Uma2 family endonuclease [Candidatus Thiosymbion oneisti]|uniref:Uma2 family endonuclease n=1 Tax=Candidatus Thiosymbion oneisti TaxID=589554 RepID=UPI000B0C93E7|nr:Uma2 family endonuclease [Candidatus Thiosymbion oneisti]
MIPALTQDSALVTDQMDRLADHIDQRVHLHDIAWEDYERLVAARGDQCGVRVTYLEGELELMAPSIHHESLKTRLARLVEAYAETVGIELEGYGSWTVKSEPQARGFEADECYVIGPIEELPEIPDIAIEVVWTSGGIDKLEVYRGLGVPEVWAWQAGSLRFFLLQGDGYLTGTRSRLLPDLDPALIARCMAQESQTRAVRALRSALGEKIERK